MKINFVKYLIAKTSELKENLPDNELFNRNEKFAIFKQQIKATFSDFETIRLEKDGSIIASNDNNSYKVLITSENHQIAITLLPYHNDKQTQFDPTEPIVVKTEAYDELEYRKLMVREDVKNEFIMEVAAAVVMRMGMDDSQVENTGIDQLLKQIIGVIIPKEIAEHYLVNADKSELYQNKEGLSMIFLGQLININLEIRGNDVKKSICEYLFVTDTGIVHVGVVNNIDITRRFTERMHSKYFELLVSREDPETLRVSFYDQDAIAALKQSGGEELLSDPTAFRTFVTQYGFEPDRELSVEYQDRLENSRYKLFVDAEEKGDLPYETISKVIPATLEPGLSFDDLLELVTKLAAEKAAITDSDRKKSGFARFFGRKT